MYIEQTVKMLLLQAKLTPAMHRKAKTLVWMGRHWILHPIAKVRRQGKGSAWRQRRTMSHWSSTLGSSGRKRCATGLGGVHTVT